MSLEKNYHAHFLDYNVLLSVDFVAYVLQKSYFLTQNVLKKWHKMSLIVLLFHFKILVDTMEN